LLKVYINGLNSSRKSSQTKFAGTLGVSFTYINCLINGKRENISPSLAILVQKIYSYSARWILYKEGSVLKKITSQTLKTRPRLIAALNTFTKEEVDLVMDHIEYFIKKTIANTAKELPRVKGIRENRQ
jgi:transcriptional regulator with XRE-family HTH domain